MTALATETTTTFCAGADTREASEVFHVEHRGGRTGQRVELARYTVARGDQRILYGQRVDGVVRVTDVAAHVSWPRIPRRAWARAGRLRGAEGARR